MTKPGEYTHYIKPPSYIGCLIDGAVPRTQRDRLLRIRDLTAQIGFEHVYQNRRHIELGKRLLIATTTGDEDTLADLETHCLELLNEVLPDDAVAIYGNDPGDIIIVPLSEIEES